MIHNKGRLLLRLAALVVLLGVLSVLVAYADPGTITIKKQTVPPGGTGFKFTDDILGGPALFYLDDGEQQKFLQVPDGTYTIAETDPAVIPGGWILTSIVCVDEKGITLWEAKQVATTTVIISSTLQTVECIFTNERLPVVGGYVIPVNKLGLLAPWLGLVALASFSVFTVALVRRRKS